MIEKLELLKSPRAIAAASVACVLAGGLACSDPEPVVLMPEPIVAAAPPAVAGAVALPAVHPTAPVVPAPLARPSHGGTVVITGPHRVEVVPHESGEVYAYPLDGAPPADAQLTVVVPVRGGVRTLALTWDPRERRFDGRVRRAQIVPGPIDVVLVAGETRWFGHIPTLVVLPAVVVVETAPASVIVVEERWHGKHRKHRGRGHGVRIHW